MLLILNVMLSRFAFIIAIFYGLMFQTLRLHAQKNASVHDKEKEKKSTGDELFGDDSIVHFKLTGKLTDLFNDRSDNSSYHPLLLQYTKKDSSLVSLNLVAKTRGHFRRVYGMCKMPPLLLSFTKAEKRKNSLFYNQSKLKLVVPCQGDDYVIREWLVYKLYNILTDKSFNAKLAMVEFEDSLKKRKNETHYCILLEDEKKMAERNEAYVWKHKMTAMRNTSSEDFKMMAAFEYLIGNTDWSVPYLQNIVLITKDSTKAPVAIPYDFDHAGIVDAPYAAPAPELGISSDRERLYRVFCEKDMISFAKTFELFNQFKPDIYNLYLNCQLLDRKYLKFITWYLDDFYKTINSNKKIEAEFGQPCRTDVRIELKGLKD